MPGRLALGVVARGWAGLAREWRRARRPLAAYGPPLALGAILVYLIHFSDIHFDQELQIPIGWGSFGLLFVLYRVNLFRRVPWRIFFILLAGFLALRYILWRTFETLLYTGPIDFIGMMLLYLAEVYAITIHFLGMFINVWPVEHEPAPLPEDPAGLPTVDVFIPTYNESEELVRITATAATQIDYPKDKLRVHILDDGGTVAKRNHPDTSEHAWERRYRLMSIARELGASYITREANRSAKAGNLNHALQHTDGELVLVLDCDHVPTRDILQNTVGHFLKDEKLFLVQTPHFFINPTPVERNLAGIASPPDENDMFFRIIHTGLDSWNSSYFCGSAALLRRSYVEEVGGISGNTITEDAETAFALHSRGYNSVYVCKPMVCGLSPETYEDYVTQRTRWAQGMVQLFLLSNPLAARGLTLPQRLCYFNSCLFWFFGMARFIYYVAPATFLILGLSIYHASWIQVLGYAVPFVLSTFIVMDFFYGRARQPFFSEIYESVQSMFLIPAVISVFLNPRKPTFKVTPKGHKLENEFLNPLSSSFFLVIVINFVALILAGWKWFLYPAFRDVILVTTVWCGYNIYLALVSLGAFWERRQIRHYHRISARGEVDVFFPRMNQEVRGALTDVSLTGVGVEIAPPFPLKEKERIAMRIAESGGRVFSFEGQIQRFFKRGERVSCGVEFVLNANSYPEIVSFVYGSSRRWQDIWEEKSRTRGTWRMLFYLVRKGIMGCILTTLAALRQLPVLAWRAGRALRFARRAA